MKDNEEFSVLDFDTIGTVFYDLRNDMQTWYHEKPAMLHVGTQTQRNEHTPFAPTQDPFSPKSTSACRILLNGMWAFDGYASLEDLPENWLSIQPQGAMPVPGNWGLNSFGKPVHGDQQLLDKGMEYNVWRAPTDNGAAIRRDWERFPLQEIAPRVYNTTVTQDEGCVTVTSQISLAWQIHHPFVRMTTAAKISANAPFSFNFSRYTQEELTCKRHHKEWHVQLCLMPSRHPQ